MILNLHRNNSTTEKSTSVYMSNIEFKNRHNFNFRVEIAHFKKRPRQFIHFPKMKLLNLPENKTLQNKRFEFSTDVSTSLYNIINKAKERLNLSNRIQREKFAKHALKAKNKFHSHKESIEVNRNNFRKINLINKYRYAIDNASRMKCKTRLKAINSLINDNSTKEIEDEIIELRKLQRRKKQKYAENLFHLSRMSNLQKKFELDKEGKKKFIFKTNNLFSKSNLKELEMKKEDEDEIFELKHKHNSVINITII